MKHRNRLTVISEIKVNGHIKLLCRCECGNTTVIFKSSFNKGTYSCGCLSAELNAFKGVRHGKCGTTEYRIWCNMKSRCKNNNSKGYANYGGRGITISEEWEIFENFYKDMGDRPGKNYTLDRIDNNKGYCKENCRWATWEIQSTNKSTNRIYNHNGKSQTIKQWAEDFGIKPNTLLYRLRRGKKFEEAIYKPIPKYTEKEFLEATK